MSSILLSFYILQSSFTVTHWVLMAFAAIIGVVIGYLIKKDNGGKATDNLEISNKVVKSLEKQLKEKNKQLLKLEKQKDSFEEENSSANKSIEELNEMLDNLKEDIENRKNEKEKVDHEKANLSAKIERTKKELEILKQKNAQESKTERAWKSEINDLKRRLNDVSKRYNNLVDANEGLKSQVKENSNFVQEMDLLRVENKGLKSKTKQLNTDVEYWEKMHYDAHHQLAELKTKQELLDKDINDKVDLISGYKIEKEKLLGMIEEYKTKYIKANNLYRSQADKVS